MLKHILCGLPTSVQATRTRFEVGGLGQALRCGASIQPRPLRVTVHRHACRSARVESTLGTRGPSRARPSAQRSCCSQRVRNVLAHRGGRPRLHTGAAGRRPRSSWCCRYRLRTCAKRQPNASPLVAGGERRRRQGCGWLGAGGREGEFVAHCAHRSPSGASSCWCHRWPGSCSDPAHTQTSVTRARTGGAGSSSQQGCRPQPHASKQWVQPESAPVASAIVGSDVQTTAGRQGRVSDCAGQAQALQAPGHLVSRSTQPSQAWPLQIRTCCCDWPHSCTCCRRPRILPAQFSSSREDGWW